VAQGKGKNNNSPPPFLMNNNTGEKAHRSNEILVEATKCLQEINNGKDEPATRYEKCRAKTIKDRTQKEKDIIKSALRRKIEDLTQKAKQRKDSSGLMNGDLGQNEVEEALKSLKPKKAGGEDTLDNDAILHASKAFKFLLSNLLQKMWKLTFTLDEWQKASINLIHKKGAKTNIDNYRPITLLNTFFKVWEKVLDARIRTHLEMNHLLSNLQLGSRMGLGTDMAILATNMIVDEAKRRNKSVLNAHIDLSKAYDRVNRNILWDKAWKLGITDTLWTCVKSTYRTPHNRITIGEHSSPYYEQTGGLRQGSCLSPILFIIYMEQLISRLQDTGDGIQYKGKIHVACIMFVDDLQLFAENIANLNKLIRVMLEVTMEMDIILNMEKLFLLTTEKTDVTQRLCKKTLLPFEAKDSHVYLGAVLCHYKKTNYGHIKQQIKKGHSTLTYLEKMAMKPGKTKLQVTITLLETIILPSILTATEAFDIKRTEVATLQHFVNTIIKNTTNAKEDCPEEWQHYELHQLPIYDHIIQRRLRLLHRIINGDDDNICQILMREDDTNFLISSVIEATQQWGDSTTLPIIIKTAKKHTVKSTLRKVKTNLLRTNLPPPKGDTEPWTTGLQAPYKQITDLNMSPEMEMVILRAREDLTYESNPERHSICYRCPRRTENTLRHEIMECTYPKTALTRNKMMDMLGDCKPGQKQQWQDMSTTQKLQTLLGKPWVKNREVQKELTKYTAQILLR
jgi:ribosomal protein L37E